MIYVSILSAIFSLIAPTVFAQDNTQTTKAAGAHFSQGTSSMASSQFAQPLTPAIINNNGTQMLARPGYYFLTEDLMFKPSKQWNNHPSINTAGDLIAWKPINGPRNIIFINSDNITLDLNNKTITQWGSYTLSISPDSTSHTSSHGVLDNTQHFPQVTDNPRNIVKELNMPNLIGIYVAPNVKNVTIKNGTINGLSGIGILIDQGCQNIKISNMNINSVGIAGIVVGHNPLRKRIIESGVYQYAIENGLLNDSTIHQSIKDGMQAPLHDQNPYTYAHEDNPTSEIILHNVLVSKTKGHHQYYLNSQAATGTASDKDAYRSKTKWLPAAVKADAIGCQIAYTNNVQIENCSFSGNQVASQVHEVKPSTGISSASSATDAQWTETNGIDQQRDLNQITSVTGATYTNQAIEGTGHNGIGLQMIWVANAHVANSHFSDNSGTTGRGVEALFCNALDFSNCSAHKNHSLYDPAQRKNNITISGTYSGSAFGSEVSNPVTNFAQWQHHIGTAAGFYLQDSSDCTFHQCEANINKGYRDAAGFWFTKWYTFETASSQSGRMFATQSAIIDNFVDRRNLGAFVYRALPITVASASPSTDKWNADTTISHIVSFGPFNNRVINCNAFSNESKYLSAYGFLVAGGESNSFEHCQARGNKAGLGTDSYFSDYLAMTNPATPGDDILKAFDDGVGATPENNAETNPPSQQPENFTLAVPLSFSVTDADKTGLWGWNKEYNYVGINTPPSAQQTQHLHTIEYGSGFALRAISLPLYNYHIGVSESATVNTNKTDANGRKMYNKHIVLADYIGPSDMLVGTPSNYLTYPHFLDSDGKAHIQAWADRGTTIEQCTSRNNNGNERGRGVGILLDGSIQSTIAHNYTFNNYANRNGTLMPIYKPNALIPDDYVTISIGGLGGYGIRDNLVDSSSLIMKNFAFANQTIYPRFLNASSLSPTESDVTTQNFIEGKNFFAQYIQATESFQSTNATVGEFGALNVANPYANIEWSHLGLPNGPIFGRQTGNGSYFNPGSSDNDLTTDWQ